MDKNFRQQFLNSWERYFPGAELPIVFYYTDDDSHGELLEAPLEHRCVICDLARARKGKSLCFHADNLGCGGAERYFGFSQELRPNFEYFLSYGIEGELEGERYKKTPELVTQTLVDQPTFEAPAKYIVFKRLDRVEEDEEPLAAVFFQPPDVLSGLFTLANFDRADPDGVIAPFCAGCASIVYHPYHQLHSEHPQAVLGMFDVSARSCVAPDLLSFAVPWPRLVQMVSNMDESFLITESWDKVRSRISTG